MEDYTLNENDEDWLKFLDYLEEAQYEPVKLLTMATALSEWLTEELGVEVVRVDQEDAVSEEEELVQYLDEEEHNTAVIHKVDFSKTVH